MRLSSLRIVPRSAALLHLYLHPCCEGKAWVCLRWHPSADSTPLLTGPTNAFGSSFVQMPWKVHALLWKPLDSTQQQEPEETKHTSSGKGFLCTCGMLHLPQCPCSNHKWVSGWQRKWDMQHITTGHATWGDSEWPTPMSRAILPILRYGKVHCTNTLWSFQSTCWLYFFVPLQRGNCQSAWGILYPVNFIGHVEEGLMSLLNKISI